MGTSPQGQNLEWTKGQLRESTEGIATDPGFLVGARKDKTRDTPTRTGQGLRLEGQLRESTEGIATDPGFLVGARNDNSAKIS